MLPVSFTILFHKERAAIPASGQIRDEKQQLWSFAKGVFRKSKTTFQRVKNLLSAILLLCLRRIRRLLEQFPERNSPGQVSACA